MSIPANRTIAIIGGGTISHVRTHFALCAPAFGGTAKRLHALCLDKIPAMQSHIYLTRMAASDSPMVTNEDVAVLVRKLVGDQSTRVIIMSAALCDFDGKVGSVDSGPRAQRLVSLGSDLNVQLTPAEKVINGIREFRKDIFLVGFKTTMTANLNMQYRQGLALCKRARCNLVLVNDFTTGINMIVAPEETTYCVTSNRSEVLSTLVDMIKLRTNLNFTRSTVVDGELVPWASPMVYPALRTVVDYCRGAGAYKAFRGATAGHFACKLDDTTFLTSVRKTNFNDLDNVGLVRIVTDGPDSVIAYGAKPSVGGQSQRIVFQDHPEFDCIVHFHCPMRPESTVNVVEQMPYECGSHECGKNTSTGLARYGNLYAVYLRDHGPNIVFHHSIDPAEVIHFIDKNFDLKAKTGGLVD